MQAVQTADSAPSGALPPEDTDALIAAAAAIGIKTMVSCDATIDRALQHKGVPSDVAEPVRNAASVLRSSTLALLEANAKKYREHQEVISSRTQLFYAHRTAGSSGKTLELKAAMCVTASRLVSTLCGAYRLEWEQAIALEMRSYHDSLENYSQACILSGIRVPLVPLARALRQLTD